MLSSTETRALSGPAKATRAVWSPVSRSRNWSASPSIPGSAGRPRSVEDVTVPVRPSTLAVWTCASNSCAVILGRSGDASATIGPNAPTPATTATAVTGTNHRRPRFVAPMSTRLAPRTRRTKPLRVGSPKRVSANYDARSTSRAERTASVGPEVSGSAARRVRPSSRRPPGSRAACPGR